MKRADHGKNPHAVALGKRGGSVTSPRKADAVRENGKKGGRPYRGTRAERMLTLVIQLAGYGCAGVGLDVDDPALCGKCAPCEAGQLLREIENGKKGGRPKGSKKGQADAAAR